MDINITVKRLGSGCNSFELDPAMRQKVEEVLIKGEVIIRIIRDLPEVLFENGDNPNFKKNDLVRARVETKLYGSVAHIDYGCGQISRLFQDRLAPCDDYHGAFELVSVLDLVRRAALPEDHPEFYDPGKFF